MRTIGLSDVHEEAFQIPLWRARASSLTLYIDGTAVMPAPEHEVLYASSAGAVQGELAWVGTGRPEAVAAVDLVGKIALVERSRSYHRSSQLRTIREAGGVAMLYTSAAVDNLRQVGSVSDSWDPDAGIPALSLGADDGGRLREALEAGSTVDAVVEVDASIEPAFGRNLVGRIVGNTGARRAGSAGSTGGAGREQIVIGAHYDTWFSGSTDNGGGIAALLALADRVARSPMPERTLIFVACDGEEIALYGGYAYQREHTVLNADPIAAVINFEIPSALDDDFFPAGLERTVTAAAGGAILRFDAASTELGTGARFVHVTAGIRYPLVERVLARERRSV